MNKHRILTDGQRPPLKPINRDSIPDAMRVEPRWMGWSFQRKSNRWAKVPVGTSTNPATWTDFDTAWASYASGTVDGLGFALGDGWAGVDLDDCRNADGELTPLAHDIINALDTYCEVSPTGSGVKLFCRANLPPGKTKNAAGTIEVYTRGRYFCVTGDRISGDIAERQAELETLRAKYIDAPSVDSALAAMLRIKPADTENDGSRRLYTYACRAVEFNLPDDTAVSTIRKAAETYQFPVHYGDSDILARIRQAEAKVVRGSGRVQIELDPGDYPGVIGKAVGALAQLDVYQHLGRLFQVNFQPPPCKFASRDNGAPRLQPIHAGAFLETLVEAADFYKHDGRSKKQVQCLPPNDLRAAIYHRGSFPGVRPINGVVSRPILLPDGRIVTEGGYNADTGLYLNIDGAWPAQKSTDESVAALFDLWGDFPFASAASQSACLAAFLTLLNRRVISGNTPLFVIDGNRSRVGKGLLSDSWTMIADGRRASRYTPGSAEELRKYLTSLAIQGADYLLFDNLQGRFGGPVIEAAMTTGVHSDRILGASKVEELPLSLTWMATGNGYTCSRDMVGRTSPIMLDSPLASPETRGGFKYANLLGHIEENRRDLLIAGLSIVANYIQAGSPKQQIPNFGGFEAWSNLIRSAVVHAGLPDPLDEREQLSTAANESSDPELRKLADAWLFTEPVTVKQALDAAASDDNFVALRSILAGCGEGSTKNDYLGKLLRTARHDFGGRKFDRTAHKTPKWFLVAAA